MLRPLLVLVALGLVSTVSAQSTDEVSATIGTAQFFPHDVRAVAMGDAGAFLPDASPLSFVQNPARLAEAAVASRLRVAGHWYQDYGENSSLGHFAATGTVGRVAVGAAASRSSASLGLDDSEDDGPTFGDASLLVGAAVRLGDARAHLDIGAAGRLTRLRYPLFTSFGGTEVDDPQIRPSIDLGAIATVNVVPAAREIAVGGFAPMAAASIGYTQRAVGPSFSLETEADTFQLDQSRDGSLGASIQIGLDAQYAGGRLRLAEIDIAAEAYTLLNQADCGVDFDQVCVQDNAALLGDIRIQDALLGTSGDPTVQGQRGVRLTLAESVWVAVGEWRSQSPFSSDRQAGFDTWGAGVSVGGVLRTIGTLSNDADARRAGERLDVTVGIARGSFSEADDDADPFYKLISVGAAVRL